MFAEDMSPFYDLAGAQAVYTDRLGVSRPCTVIVDDQLQAYGEVAVFNVRTAVLSVRVSEVPSAPRAGDVFAVSGRVAPLRVDSLQSSDPMEYRVFVA